MSVKHVVGCGCVCGEAPIWKNETDEIYWVDTRNNYCYSIEVGTGVVKQIPVEDKYQALGIRKEGGWICPTPTNIHLVDSDFHVEKDLGRLLPDDSEMVLNDGTVGPDGCYYLGYYDPNNLEAKTGGVLRVNIDLSIETIVEGYALPNGMAFSKNNSKFYLTEMMANAIWEFDFDKTTGSLSNRKKLVSVKDDGCGNHPDGLIVDSEGYLWSAEWQGFKIVRYAPDGSVDMAIEVPVPTPTCMVFGSDGELFITTATLCCTDQQLADYPNSGDCYSYSTKTSGVEEQMFLG